MPNTWDPPPRPEHGDLDKKVLYESIGRALTAWEDLESFLAHLYAGLSEQSLYNQNAINEYGTFANIPARAKELVSCGEKYFIKYSNQKLEIVFCWIIKNFKGWSDRRNDVAHSVVRQINIAKDPSASLLESPPGWCLVPPHFKGVKYLSPNTPARILTSVEIKRFYVAFEEILGPVRELSQAVELPRYASRREHEGQQSLLGSLPYD